MSANNPNVNVVRVQDPRLDLHNRKDYVASKGSVVNSWQQFNATNVSNSSVQISCNPPSREIVISRLVFKRNVYNISITGTNTGGGTLLVPGHYAPRAFPISSTTSAEQMTINNATITQSPISQYWSSLLWYHNNLKNRTGQYSLCPSMLDQFQTYAEGALTNRNPLGGYGDGSSGGDDPRGAYSGLQVLTNPVGGGGGTATLLLTCTEPVLLSPFVFGENSNTTSGFANIQNMSYTSTFGNLSRVMSLIPDQGAPGVIAITDVSVNIASSSLLFNYLTPEVSPPRQIESSYFSIVSYPTRLGTPVAPGATASFTMNSVQVSSIPRRIYVYAREDDSLSTAFTTDTHLSLPLTGNPLTMTWNNNQFFSQATSQDLYNISVKNGCTMNFNQFSKHTGSVLCLDFGAGDVGLMPLQSAGSIGNYQMGLTCQLTNTSSVAIANPTLYVVVVYEGVFNINDGNCSQYLGVLTPQDVANARPSANITFNQAQDIYGGSFFTKLWKGLKKVGKFAKDKKLLSRGLSMIPDPRAQMAGRVASAVGYGSSGGRMMRYGGGLADDEDEKKDNTLNLIQRLTCDSDGEY